MLVVGNLGRGVFLLDRGGLAKEGRLAIGWQDPVGHLRAGEGTDGWCFGRATADERGKLEVRGRTACTGVLPDRSCFGCPAEWLDAAHGRAELVS